MKKTIPNRNSFLIAVLRIWLGLIGIFVQVTTAQDCNYTAGLSTYVKVKFNFQTNAVYSDVTNGASGFHFEAAISAWDATNFGLFLPVSSATLVTPDGVHRLFTENPLSPGSLAIGESFLTENSLNEAFPLTNLILSVNNQFSNGAITSDFTVPLSKAAWPETPFVSNFDAAQEILPNGDFRLHLRSPTGLGESDAISLTISAGELDNLAVVTNIVVTGSSDAIILPANTLEPSTSYQALLSYSKIADFGLAHAKANEAGLCLGYGITYTTLTQFTLRTTEAVIRPKLTIESENKATGIRISFDTNPGSTYHLLFSSDLQRTPEWLTLLNTNAAGTFVSLSDLNFNTNQSAGFYRVISAP